MKYVSLFTPVSSAITMIEEDPARFCLIVVICIGIALVNRAYEKRAQKM